MTASSGQAAVSNADDYTSYEVGMCLKYVRGPCWGVGSFYGSAIDAWNGAKFKHPGDWDAPMGAPMFYAGGQYGHIVISRGDGRMRSTDCTTSGRVNNADGDWPEEAWGDDYLGWTEDLNGVDLPLDTDNHPGDDMPQYDHGATSKTTKIKANEWVAITWASASGEGAFKAGDKLVALGGRTYTATIHASFDAPEGSTLRMRCVEVEGGETLETNAQTEALATSGSTAASHSQNGYVSGGRSWAVRVSCSQDATLTAADAVVLSWD